MKSFPLLRTLWWFPGPILAVALVVFGASGTLRIGVLLAYLFGGALLMFGAPAIQWLLLATDRFRGRDAAACGVALLAIAIVIAVPFLVRAFELF